MLLVLSLLVLVTACGGNDNGSSTNDLLGTWVAVSFDGNSESTTTFDGTTTTSEVAILGSNLDYRVTFTETAWTTAGGYDVTSTTSVNGMPAATLTSSNTNVSGSGTYSIDGNVMTIDGSFFELETNGVPTTGTSGPQMANFEINSNGELVFSQDETIESNQSGVESTTALMTTSVWRRE